MTRLYFFVTDRFVFLYVFVFWRKINGPVNACHSFYLVIRCVNSWWCKTQKLRRIRNQPALQPAHALVKTICIVRLRMGAQKLVLISCIVARTYVSVSDRRVSHGFLLRPTIGLILIARDSWAQWHVKIHRGELARIVYNKQFDSSSNFLKPFLWTKKCFERIPSRQEFASKFADLFSSVFQSLQMLCRVFCNLADSSSVKTNQEIMMFTAKKRNYTH